MVVERVAKRASVYAALFLFVGAGAALGGLAMAPAAFAKMRLEKLGIIADAGSGAARLFSVEVAETDQEKAVGLMFRTRLGDGEGMLFPYGREQVLTMWMRNTYIPLDMVFIRADGVITRIEISAEPLSEKIISSGGAAAAVLELAGGATARLGVKVGDKVLHRAFGTAVP